jgi:hypothetical protein
MDETSINITPPSFDITRNELLWECREEDVLILWKKDCVSRSKAHQLKSKKNKMLYSIFGIPSIVIPLVLSGTAAIIPCHSLIYSISMMLAALFNAISLFFNFGKKQSSHNNYSNRYFELSSDITCELCKPKVARIQCSVFLERIKQKYLSLVKQAPTI